MFPLFCLSVWDPPSQNAPVTTFQTGFLDYPRSEVGRYTSFVSEDGRSPTSLFRPVGHQRCLLFRESVKTRLGQENWLLKFTFVLFNFP